ncbi:MAG TPA: GTPase domain-containing protein [Candidatus Limnocylindria bacterium]|nr:GTPase domain-containing protein [Candidatus Limnocylindria bacterium]
MDPAASDLIERSDRLADLAEQRLALAPANPAAQERARQLRDHLEGFVRPRAADLDAPLLVLLLGPTGAGKSSLINTIAGAEVSRAGVLRPTTREAILYASESDAKKILSGARLRLASTDRIVHAVAPDTSTGVAVIDAPDIDSVERDNRELADLLLEACDLCVFVTTATRYADLVPWQVLHRAQERGLPLVVLLNRVPTDERDRDVVLADARRLLAEAGMREEDDTLDLMAVTEGDVDPRVNGLARDRVRPLLDRIEQLASEKDERRAVAVDSLAGAVRGLAPLVHNVADDLEHEAIDAEALRRIAETSYAEELAVLSRSLRSGVLLRGEVLRQWHDFVGADQITRFVSSGLGRLRGLLMTAFRGSPTAPVAMVEEEVASTLEALALRHASDAARRTATAWSDRSDAAALIDRDPTLWSASDGFAPAIREGLAAWMRATIDDVRTGGGRKKAVAQVAALGVNVVGVAVMLGVFVHTAGITGAEVGIAAGTAFLNQKLLEALFGERAMEQLIEQARLRLDALLTTLFAKERERFDALATTPATLRDLAAQLRAAVTDLRA